MTSRVINHDHHHVRIYTRPLYVAYGLTPSQGYMSKSAATLVTTALTSPFHVIQTLAQVGSKEGRKSYKAIITDLWDREGIAPFFKGSLVGAIKFGTQAALNYGIYLGVRKLLQDKEGTLTFDNHQIANAASLILSSFLSYPLEVIRTRLVLDWDNKKYNGALDCLTNTINTEGWSGLFSGAVLAAVGNYLMVEIMERIWSPIRLGLAFVPPSLVDAGLQSLLAETLYYPIDTVLKMVQAPSAYRKLHPDTEFEGPLSAALSRVDKHGFFSLWSGYPVAVVKVIPYVFLLGFSYQGATRIFEEVNEHTPVVVGTPAVSETVVVSPTTTRRVVTRVEKLD